MLIRKFLVAMLLPALLAPLSSRAEPLYSVQFLPTDFTPVDINNVGQIVGNIGVSGGYTHGVLYDDGVLTDLGTLGGTTSVATALNDAGDVTGASATASGGGEAFIYRNGSMTGIGAQMQGLAINAQGDIAGYKFTGPTYSYTGFVYRNGTVTELGNLGTGIFGIATDINDLGDVVGESTITNIPIHDPLHPFLYRDGVLTDLGTLADQEENGAIGINNAGQIAGYSVVESQDWHAFRYEGGVMKDLGNLGGRYLWVEDFNEQGELVGDGETATGYAAFRSVGDALVALDTLIDPALGWHIETAFANNDVGQILGYGCRDGACGTVLLSAVPEPGSALLLVPGLLVLAGAYRRRRPFTRTANTSFSLSM